MSPRSGPDRLPELEARLARGLEELAGRAVAAPDALERILAGDGAIGMPATVARSRSRRPLVAALTAAVAAAVSLLLAGALSPSPRPTSVVSATAGVRALAPVAWVAGGRLEVATPGAPARVVASRDHPEDPQWSVDHRWLAYLDGDRRQVHVVAMDGGGDHAVAIRAVGRGGYAWSPTGDRLAVVPAGGGIQVVSLPGRTATTAVARGIPVESIAWSRDGGRLAYSTPAAPTRRTGVVVVDLADRVTESVPLTAPPGSDVLLAGWWPDGTGLVYWVDPDGSPAALGQGLPMMSVPLIGGPGRLLGVTLVFHPWVSWSPDGTRLLLVAGAGSYPSSGKSLVVCDEAGASCRPLPQPDGTVSLDAAWSPDGTEIALVRAPDTGDLRRPGGGWYAARRLWVEAADGSGAAPVAGAAPGATLPAWSHDGRAIGCSLGSGIQVVPASGGRPTTIASGLGGPNDGTAGPDAEGKLPWSAVALWGGRGGFDSYGY